MTNRAPFHVFAIVGDQKYDHLKVGSVRLGRTLRAAAAIKRYTNATIVVAQADENNKPTGEQHYPVVSISDEEIQRRNRQRAQMSAAASMVEHRQRRPRKSRSAQ